MKKISRQTMRSKAVGNILASLRMEQLTPSATVIQGMKACVAGDETMGNLLAGIMRQHVTLRRG